MKRRSFSRGNCTIECCNGSRKSRGSEKNEAELKRKADEKGKRYYGIPHDSKRWRMIVGNVMLEMIGER